MFSTSPTSSCVDDEFFEQLLTTLKRAKKEQREREYLHKVNCISKNVHSNFLLSAQQQLVLCWRSSCTYTILHLKKSVNLSAGEYFLVFRNEDNEIDVKLKASARSLMNNKSLLWRIKDDLTSVRVKQSSMYTCTFSVSEDFKFKASLRLSRALFSGAVFELNLYKKITDNNHNNLIEIIDENPNTRTTISESPDDSQDETTDIVEE
jgi:hypothetical protein